MLEQLVKYAERENLGADPCFESKEVKWTIVLDDDGAFIGVTPLGSPEERRWRGKAFPQAPLTPGNELQSGGKSHFLSETVETVLCLFPEKPKGNKTIEQMAQSIEEKHNYFIGLIKESFQGGVETFEPIVRFFTDSKEIETAQLSLAAYKQLKTTDMITFDVDGECVLEQNDWHSFWRKKRQPSKKSESSKEEKVPCFATGVLATPIRTHGKIKGIWGGNPTGTALVANDKDAFQSYSLEKSKNAAVSVEAESRYRAALQALLKKAVSLGGVQFIYWTREETDIDPVKTLFDQLAVDEGIQEASLPFKAIRKGGQKPHGDAANTFYGCALNGNGGRIVIRDWWEISLEAVCGHVNDWFEDVSISKNRDGVIAVTPKFYTFLSVLVRKKQGKPQVDDLPKHIPIQLMRAALCGFPLPRAVLDKAIERHIIEVRDGTVRAERMGLIRAYLNRLYRTGGEKMTEGLNKESKNIAYQCGRLFAMFEKVQFRALGKINANVVQKYYGAASVTPGLVMGRLFRTAQHHLGSIDKPGYYQETIGEITQKIGENFPPSLKLEDQGRFALGYYHQRTG